MIICRTFFTPILFFGFALCVSSSILVYETLESVFLFCICCTIVNCALRALCLLVIRAWPCGQVGWSRRPDLRWHWVAAKGLIQYLVRKGLGVILFFCYSYFYNLWVPWFSLLEIYQNSFHAVWWAPCVVRFTIFYGFHSNLLWVAVNSDLVVWQTVVSCGGKRIKYNRVVNHRNLVISILVIWYKGKPWCFRQSGISALVSFLFQSKRFYSASVRNLRLALDAGCYIETATLSYLPSKSVNTNSSPEFLATNGS